MIRQKKYCNIKIDNLIKNGHGYFFVKQFEDYILIKKTLISSLFFVAVLPSAYALNDGKLDGILFETRIRTTIKKNYSINETSAPYELTADKIKFDSGRKSCYSSLYWKGNQVIPDTGAYRLITVCNGASGWEKTDEETLQELSDGSVGDDWPWTPYVTRSGGTIYPNWTEFAGYVGTLVLKATFKSDGTVKNVKLQKPQGLIDWGNFDTNTFGTAKSGLKMKRVDVDSVDTGAIACISDYIKWVDGNDLTIPEIENCGN